MLRMAERLISQRGAVHPSCKMMTRSAGGGLDAAAAPASVRILYAELQTTTHIQYYRLETRGCSVLCGFTG